MARPKAENLTVAEHRIMQVLWEKNEATVRDITDALAQKHNLAYTTVLTTTRILADKGYVEFHKDGRSHVFRPLVTKSKARSNALKTLMGNLFDGSPRLLAQHLIEADELSGEDIAALRALLARDEKGDTQ
ncbi:MAG: MarR family transcriptional regulator [Robiginitomaculum sp.]|nr:MAG: MarR family transcriptional regulator [Robiginitomaculum sp.]